MIQVDFNKDYRHRMHLNNQHLVRLNWPPVFAYIWRFILHEYNESARYSYNLVFEAISISAYKTKQIWIRIILPGSEAHFLFCDPIRKKFQFWVGKGALKGLGYEIEFKYFDKNGNLVINSRSK